MIRKLTSRLNLSPSLLINAYKLVSQPGEYLRDNKNYK